jgi:hypothetical protein
VGRAGRIEVRFRVKACWATFLYALIHSLTVILSRPSIIAMILHIVVSRPVEGSDKNAIPSSARTTDQVEIFARP